MKGNLINLKECNLFKGLSYERIERLIVSIRYTRKNYKNKDIMVIKGDQCKEIGIILEGQVKIYKSFPSGKEVIISNFYKGDIFGEALIFTEENVYPANIEAVTDSEVLYINKKEFIKLIKSDNLIFENFATVLSKRIIMLSKRLSGLELDSIRKKIANLILEEYKKEGRNKIILGYNRKEMGELLNVQRPSLSRELKKMREDGIIEFYKNTIEILDIDKLEEILLA